MKFLYKLNLAMQGFTYGTYMYKVCLTNTALFWPDFQIGSVRRWWWWEEPIAYHF